MSVRARLAAGVAKAFTKAGDAIEDGVLNVQTVGDYNTITGKQEITVTDTPFKAVEISTDSLRTVGLAPGDVHEGEIVILINAEAGTIPVPKLDDEVTFRSRTPSVRKVSEILDVAYVVILAGFNP